MADENEIKNAVVEKIQRAARMHLSAVDEIIFLPVERYLELDSDDLKNQPYFIFDGKTVGLFSEKIALPYNRLVEIKNELIESKRGKIVLPTSKEVTVGYYLFSYRALKEPIIVTEEDEPKPRFANDGEESRRDLAFNELTEDETNWLKKEDLPLDNFIQGEGDIKADTYKVGDSNVTIFGVEEREDELRYFSPKVWGNEETPSFLKGKQNKALIERFKLMKDLQPKDKEADDNKVISKESGMSPITKYYLMRYLGFYLSAPRKGDDAKTSIAGTAIPTLDETTGKLTLNRIDITRQENFDLETELRLMIEGEIENESIDDRFPFDRLRTIYRYSDDWVEKALAATSLLDIEEPDPTDRDVVPQKDVKYGMLQKLFTILPTNQKNKFYESVVSQIYEKMPTIKIGLSHLGGVQGDLNLTRQYDSTTIPFLNGSFAIAETLKAFAESDPSDGKKDRLKLRTNLEDKESMQLITDGTIVTIPGWLILFSEKADKKYFLEGMMNIRFSQLFSELGKKSRRRLTKSEGTNHIMDIIWYIRSNEELLGVSDEDLYNVLNQSYEAIVTTIGDTVQATIIEEQQYTTLTLDRKKLMAGFTIKDFQDSIIDEDDEGDSWFARNGTADPKSPEWNSVSDVKDGDDIIEVSASNAFTESTGLQQNQLTPHNARAFNALGHVVEEMMIHSGVEAVRNVTDTALTSDFDKIVMGLIGTNKNPGMAVFHSIVHYQYLFAIVTNPITRWESIDKDIFQQGAMLSLESFLTEPAKKTLLYMLNEKGFIDVGDFSERAPKFFKVPVAPSVNVANFTGLMNSFALIMISYYRLMFAQIRNRLVFERKTQTKGKVSRETADLSKYWRDMIADAERNTPSPALFGLVLRWFGQTGTVLEVPTWMPVSPAEMKSDAKMNKNDVLNYLKWSYSNNAVDLEAFSEVAAAYHSAKAMSYLEGEKNIAAGYAEMIQRFVDAVHEDMGHAFLFSILNHPNCPDPTKETPEAEKVIAISNIEALMKEAAAPSPSSAPGGTPAGAGPPSSGAPSSAPVEAPVSASPEKPVTPASSNPMIPEATRLAQLITAFRNEFGATGEDQFKKYGESRPSAQVILDLTNTVEKKYDDLDDTDKDLILSMSGDDLHPSAFTDIFKSIRSALLVGIEYGDDEKGHRLYMMQMINNGGYPNLDEELFEPSVRTYSVVTALEFLGEYE